uniref:Protein kinase domain-containing protein n=1 Tax=Meloidogyne javanica TaxID=6303 RepID=A0A915N6R2_MELJA
MSVRPREGDLNVRAGFTFESERSTYKLEELIGDGGYGQVFEADAISKGKKQDTKRLAVKLERRSGATDIEARVLETAKDKNCRHIPKIFDHGVIQSRGCSFIAMELKGRDLYRLRKDRNNGSFTLGTAVRVALVTLEAIRELHEVCGFISRDIKAGNFVTGQTTSDDIRNIYLIDFGLSRKYKDANNNIVVARPDVGWRGTTRYGSRNRAAVYKSKLAALSNLDDFLNGCPQGYRELIGPIIKLNFGDAPAYKEMGRVLERIITEQGIDKKGKMDWELAEEPEVAAEGEQQLDSFPTSTTQRRV